jgi:tricorn protease interacting factor F2/3
MVGMAESKHFTLGDNVVPEEYSITMEPDLKSSSFKGSEVIKATVKKHTKLIRINSKNIRIEEAWVKDSSGDYKAAVSYKPKVEEVSLLLPAAVSGKISIHLVFGGKISDGLSGMYKSKYTIKGKDSYIITTQFEAPNARAAFPCFDEPEFKARFKLSLIIAKGLDAISNTPIEKTEKASGSKKKVCFLRTPLMSTYLVYIGVGNYDYVHGQTGKTKIRVVTVPGKGKSGKLAVSFVEKFIPFYEKYFGIKFPMQKLDLIAIPDFAAGAMENWGAITFRETELLGDEKKISVATKQRIAEVIAHELVHHWFGDLVTMRWWDDLWLNESFATYMSYKAMDAVFPEWKILTQYLLDTVSPALSADSLKSTHPISTSVRSPAEIDAVFDNISYDKGGSLLAMLDDYVGYATFRKGLSAYLKKHSYGNAQGKDLWDALAHAAGSSNTTVSKMASYWILNPGYPIIDVKVADDGYAHLRQRRFMLNENGNAYKPWPIALHYKVVGAADGSTLFGSRERSLKIKKGNTIKLNYGQKGLYRARYDDKTLQKLGAAISSGKLEGVDVWGIENDLFAITRKGEVSAGKYLSFVENYCMKSFYPVDSSIISHIMWIYYMLYGTGKEGKAKRLGLRYCNSWLKRFGTKPTKGEQNSNIIVRSEAIGALGVLGDKKIINMAETLFIARYKKKKAIDPNLAGAVYRIVAYNFGAKYEKRIRELYLKSGLEESRKFLVSLGMFNDSVLIKRYLDYSLSKDVRLQDSFLLPAIISGGLFGKELTLAWTEKNWQKLMKTFDPGTHMLTRYIENFSSVSDKKLYSEIKEFFSRKKNLRGDTPRYLKQVLERMEANIRFLKTNGVKK